MRQIFQNQRTGETEILEVPCPQLGAGSVLIRNVTTLISAGTERAVVDFGRAGLLSKAAKNPDKVRMVLGKVRSEGLIQTIEAVSNKLEQRIALGYCSAGIVLDVGLGVQNFRPGDRVASNGKHAEIVSVPYHLCTKISDGVSYDEAAFTVIGAIALQGIRLANPTIGESFVVLGLGLVGLVTIQLLIANGCRVLGIDLDDQKRALAKKIGAATVNASDKALTLSEVMEFSRGRGVDGVIITAATKSNEPIEQSARMSRKRGRIVLVGVVGLELSRDDFYEKELSFQVSCSYGPGRYDPFYEEQGHDYPLAYVRWTEQRNMEAMMDMLANGRVDVSPLISHRFPLDTAGDAYSLLSGSSPYLGILLKYSDEVEKPSDVLQERTVAIAHTLSRTGTPESGPVVSFIGAGDHALRILIPAFRKGGAILKSIASSSGVTGVMAGKKNSFAETTTDTAALLQDQEAHAVVIATRHNTHARLVRMALESGKHVFCEKPLALGYEELNEIIQLYGSMVQDNAPPVLTVGFNRRFSPLVQKMMVLLKRISLPKCMIMTVNAGYLPPDHWTQDLDVGGGRIIGEACHFIDLLRYLADSSIASIHAIQMGGTSGSDIQSDKATLTLQFYDGSLGTVHYFANGHSSFPKERLEVFCAGRVLQLDNFIRLRGYGWEGFRKQYLWRQNKGHGECVEEFLRAVRSGGPNPIPFDELVEVTEASIKANNMLKGVF